MATNSAGARALSIAGSVLLTIVLTLSLGEALLRLKNIDQRNYTIEMWRYARTLKRPADNPSMGHVHIPNSHAVLEGVDIRINSLGMRGPEPDLLSKDRKRILLLGGSITLGWGVSEQQTMRAELARKLGHGFEVMNAGIGNTNMPRYIEAFDRLRRVVKPDVVIVNVFARDAEALPPSRRNWILEHSELAVLAVSLYEQWQLGAGRDLSEYYRQMWLSSAGRAAIRQSLDRLAAMQTEDKFEVVLTLVPDMHHLETDPVPIVASSVRAEAARHGWRFVDLRPALKGHAGPDLWVMPGDPHPNGYAQVTMADYLAATLQHIP